MLGLVSKYMLLTKFPKSSSRRSSFPSLEAVLYWATNASGESSIHTMLPGYTQSALDPNRPRYWSEHPRSLRWHLQQLWRQPWYGNVSFRNTKWGLPMLIVTRRAGTSVISACKTCTLVCWEARFKRSVDVALFRVRAKTIFCGLALYMLYSIMERGMGRGDKWHARCIWWRRTVIKGSIFCT